MIDNVSLKGKSFLGFNGIMVCLWAYYLHVLTFLLSFTGLLGKKVKVRVVLVRTRNRLKRE